MEASIFLAGFTVGVIVMTIVSVLIVRFTK